jgi:DNA-directed RNA polymerase subunit RPC12/RpoP
MPSVVEKRVNSFSRTAANELAKGYYPTHPKDISLLCKLLHLNGGYTRGNGKKRKSLSICDPCAGHGAFLRAIKRRFLSLHTKYVHQMSCCNNGYYGFDIRSYAVELDANRCDEISGCYQKLNASFFDVSVSGMFDVVLLNPPYNRQSNKLLKWMESATRTLRITGCMILIIPDYELKKPQMLEFIKDNFKFSYVFKSTNYNQFKQVVAVLSKGSHRYNEITGASWGVNYDSNLAKDEYPCLSNVGLESRKFTIQGSQKPAPLLISQNLDDFYQRCAQSVKDSADINLSNIYPQVYDKNIKPLSTLRTAHAIQLAAMNSQVEAVAINGKKFLAKYMLVDKTETHDNSDEQTRTTITRPVVDARLMDEHGNIHLPADLGFPYFELNSKLSSLLLQKLSRQYKPVHEIGTDQGYLQDQMDQIGLMPPQKEAVRALMKGYESGAKALGIRANTGTGKAFVMKAIALLLNVKRSLVVTEPHLVPQLVEEYSNEQFDLHVIDSWEKAKELSTTQPAGMYLIAYSRLRMHPKFVSCAVEKQHRETNADGNVEISTMWHCPDCWSPISTKALPKKKKLKCPHCNGVLYTYIPEGSTLRYSYGQWINAVEQEAIVPHTSENKQLPYVRLINQIPFDLAGFDEVHNAASVTSNQGASFLRVMSKAKRSLCLTATLTNGIAKSLYNILWGMMPEKMAADGWDRNSSVLFQKRYGAFRTIVKTEGDGNRHRSGESAKTYDSPGISPAVLKYTLGSFVNMASSDFTDMPPVRRTCYSCNPHPRFEKGIGKITEIIQDANLSPADRLAAVSVRNNAVLRLSDTYHHFDDTLMLRDQFLGTLQRDPIPKLSEKEERLIEIVSEAKRNGERVLLYSGITQKIDIRPVLKRLVQQYTDCSVDSLPDTVPAQKVVSWFTKSKADVTIASFKRVGTGLNLSQYTYVVWYDYTDESRRAEQGDGRVRRVNTAMLHRKIFGCVKEIKYFYLTSSKFREAQLSYTLEKRMVSSLIEGEVPEIDPSTTSGGDSSFSSILTRALQDGDISYSDPSDLLRSMMQEDNARIDATNRPECNPVREKPAEDHVHTSFANSVDESSLDESESSLFDYSYPQPEPGAKEVQLSLF